MYEDTSKYLKLGKKIASSVLRDQADINEITAKVAEAEDLSLPEVEAVVFKTNKLMDAVQMKRGASKSELFPVADYNAIIDLLNDTSKTASAETQIAIDRKILKTLDKNPYFDKYAKLGPNSFDNTLNYKHSASEALQNYYDQFVELRKEADANRINRQSRIKDLFEDLFDSIQEDCYEGKNLQDLKLAMVLQTPVNRIKDMVNVFDALEDRLPRQAKKIAGADLDTGSGVEHLIGTVSHATTSPDLPKENPSVILKIMADPELKKEEKIIFIAGDDKTMRIYDELKNNIFAEKRLEKTFQDCEDASDFVKKIKYRIVSHDDIQSEINNTIRNRMENKLKDIEAELKQACVDEVEEPEQYIKLNLNHLKKYAQALYKKSTKETFSVDDLEKKIAESKKQSEGRDLPGFQTSDSNNKLPEATKGIDIEEADKNLGNPNKIPPPPSLQPNGGAPKPPTPPKPPEAKNASSSLVYTATINDKEAFIGALGAGLRTVGKVIGSGVGTVGKVLGSAGKAAIKGSRSAVAGPAVSLSNKLSDNKDKPNPVKKPSEVKPVTKIGSNSLVFKLRLNKEEGFENTKTDPKKQPKLSIDQRISNFKDKTPTIPPLRPNKEAGGKAILPMISKVTETIGKGVKKAPHELTNIGKTLKSKINPGVIDFGKKVISKNLRKNVSTHTPTQTLE